MFLVPPFLRQFLANRRKKNRPRVFLEDAQLAVRLKQIAAGQKRAEQEVYSEIMAAGMKALQDQDAYASVWDSLSQREQQVTALTCLGHSSSEIADMLGISYETVRTHSKHVYVKFGLNRKELRQALKDWNFQEWLESSGSSGI